ncbi:MAG: SCP2 sterol-binding domain-containing protein [Geopsychrobacter sp.]|nr:SCP2 sterol-binding domain-containing protein [Geopsychrobacter sp.]
MSTVLGTGTLPVPLSVRSQRSVQDFMLRMLFWLVGQAFLAAARWDKGLRRELAGWEEGFVLRFMVAPVGPMLLLKKRQGRLRYQGGSGSQADLTICFKTLGAALRLFTARLSFSDAFAQHRVSVVGDVARAMSVYRCFNQVQFYLLPGIMARKVLKRKPPLTFGALLIRCYVWFVGIPCGLFIPIRRRM